VGLNRYYVPNLPPAGEVALSPDEAHHAVRVRREEVGDQCILFDGRGNQAAATFERADKREAVLLIDSFQWNPKVLPGSITIGVAMPKGERQKEVIEKAVELGVHRLIPILTQRSVSISETSHLEKWRRYVIESCKQCERNLLMEIESPKLFGDLIDKTEQAPNGRYLIAHPKPTIDESKSPIATSIEESQAFSLGNPLQLERAPSVDSVFILVGPEGGFTDQEVQLALDRRWERLDLGPRVLRVETAVSMASVLAGLFVERSRWVTAEALKTDSLDP
jgi:16S rRNA (uracil1498-N3)-methyltransferase